MRRETEEIVVPLPLGKEEKRFLFVSEPTAIKSESEGTVERIAWTSNVRGEGEIRIRLENCGDGHVYEVISQMEMGIYRTVL